VALEVESPQSAAPGALKYRAHIDGLRTVSVYLVVAFHAGLGIFNAGYLGVDVFFVLSGFLVTSILLRDLVQGGRPRWRHFYSRRVRRILPAALVVLLITAVAYSMVAAPSQALDALGGFRASCLYIANWFFIRQGADYFAADVNSNPVLHFWSLAVEEQFYFVWPLLLAALYALSRATGRWRWWVLRGAVVSLALASALFAVHIAQSDLSRAYYGTDTRAYELLMGALIALSPQLFRLRRQGWNVPAWSASALLCALLLVATSVVHFGAIAKGIVATLIVSALIVALENIRGSRAKSLLSSRPFVYLGRISYGTYLWHWPVIVLVTLNRHVSPVLLFAFVVPVATLISAASYRLLEMPIRRSEKLDHYRKLVIVAGFATSILVGIFVMPAILQPASGAAWETARTDIPAIPNCYLKPVRLCTLVHGSRGRIVLIGDSHAGMWIPAFEGVARRNNLTFSVLALPHCPWQYDTSVVTNAKNLHSCVLHQSDWYRRALPLLRPDVVFLVHEEYDDPHYPRIITVNGVQGRTRTPVIERALIKNTQLWSRKLAAQYPKVVMIEPAPFSPFDPLSCISGGSSLDHCSYMTNRLHTQLEQAEEAESDGKHIWALDLDKVVCPRFPKCDAIVNGLIVKRDKSHLTGSFSRSVSPEIDTLLHRDGVLVAH
jgi:peptidoglycan/LPS O-acetylase OafA/YrhL